MSCNYADGLSPYEDKGVLGVPEKFDTVEDVESKCVQLVELLKKAEHVVVHTGAGISTSAGIPDFRGPKGVWTLEEKGQKPANNISFNDAMPTTTHMALRALVDAGRVHYIVSQNIDGLHLKSGLNRKYIAELHGNMFVEQCCRCRRQFVRKSAATTVGQKPCGGRCRGGRNERACRNGILLDNVLDWEHDLPERDLDMAVMHSTMADVNITLGTTLQIIPSGNLPLKNKKCGGKIVICNLQPTKHDKKADLIISTYVDDVLKKVCKRLGIEIPEYNPLEDPTKSCRGHEIFNWTLPTEWIKNTERSYNAYVKQYAVKKTLGRKQDSPDRKAEQISSKKQKIKDEALKIESNAT